MSYILFDEPEELVICMTGAEKVSLIAELAKLILEPSKPATINISSIHGKFIKKILLVTNVSDLSIK